MSSGSKKTIGITLALAALVLVVLGVPRLGRSSPPSERDRAIASVLRVANVALHASNKKADVTAVPFCKVAKSKRLYGCLLRSQQCAVVVFRYNPKTDRSVITKATAVLSKYCN